MTSGSLSPRRKSLSTPHTTWMSVTLLRAGSTPPALSSFRFHSRTSCSAPGTRYRPVWGTGKGAQPCGNHSIATFTILAPTSVKPRVSTSVTHCTTSVGTRGGVEGAKSASTPWGEQCQPVLCPPHSPAARVGRGPAS